MTTAIGAFNHLLTALFGLVCAPFRTLAPIWPIAFVSLLTGAAMVWVFGKVSNQKAIRVVRDRIRGNLIGVGLFRNDVGTVLRLQGRILRDTLTYMRHSVVPMLVTVVPVVLIAIQLNLRFSVRPLLPGETAVVNAKMRNGADPTVASLILSPEGKGIVVETPPVCVASQRAVSWRVRAAEAGRFSLMLHAENENLSKEILAGATSWRAVSAIRTGAGEMDMLLWPGEKPIPPGSAFELVEVIYPPLHVNVFGWRIHWLVLFFVLSIICGFALKGPLGVEV